MRYPLQQFTLLSQFLRERENHALLKEGAKVKSIDIDTV